MLKNFAKVFVVFLILLLSVEVVYAANFKSFGGRITQAVSDKEIAEGRNYKCDKPGATFEVKYKGIIKKYYIPSGVRSKTKTTLRSGQDILGLSSFGLEPMHCTKNKGEKDEDTDTFYFYRVILYGTSKN